MLVLQILSAALAISLAKANPVAVDVHNWENPSADGAFKRKELIVASPAGHYSQYIPGPTETSLTLRYHQERATCLDQFVWYCQIPAGACIAAVGSIAPPINLWSLLPCAIAAICASVALTLGALCCNGVIKNCDNPSGFASGTRPVTGNVMAALNGGNGDTPFTRDTFRNGFNSYLWSHGSEVPNDDDFNNMYNNFLNRAFCSFGPGEGGNGCHPASVSRDSVRSPFNRSY